MDVKLQAKTSRNRTSWPVIVWVRKLHLYSGVLFAPAILFFAVTGLIQVFNLHKPQPATGYQPPALVLRLGALHKDQTFTLPHKGDGAKAAKKHGDGGKATAPAEAAPPHPPEPMGLAQALLKGFAAAVAVGLVAATLLGLYMAYRFNRSLWLVGGLFIAGIVVPVILIAASPN
jgi:hypothetical protein